MFLSSRRYLMNQSKSSFHLSLSLKCAGHSNVSLSDLFAYWFGVNCFLTWCKWFNRQSYKILPRVQSLNNQKWLREIIRDEIILRAKIVLPPRLRELEQKHNLHGNRVFIKKLRGNIMGCCSIYNDISLIPGVIIMPQALIDSVILHEMAHYMYKHHRKSFWNFLSQLLGEDAQTQKGAMDIVLSKYWLQIKFLMKWYFI